jgi:N-acetylmuramoyl-L-alanine amidase
MKLGLALVLVVLLVSSLAVGSSADDDAAAVLGGLAVSRQGNVYAATLRYEASGAAHVHLQVSIQGRRIGHAWETIGRSDLRRIVDAGEGVVSTRLTRGALRRCSVRMDLCELEGQAQIRSSAPGGATWSDRLTRGDPRPPLRDSTIPFGKRRTSQTRAYTKRHYGKQITRLRPPRTIVQHFTATSRLRPVIRTFASNAPDHEYGELPGSCTQFAIDRDGTIHRLTSPTRVCRHVAGLNHVAIGVEHVGRSDGEVMDRGRQIRSSLHLSHWLRCRFGIRTRDVIGHNESLDSPYYREQDPRFRGDTHEDFRPPTMRRYREMIARHSC